jgi:alpha,alpha-trehalose phosphorylase
MIEQAGFPVEPWCVRETHLDLDLLAQSESVFALSNGHLGLRGNLDEGEPSGISGTYLNAFYEQRPLPYAEQAYGNPEEGQTVVNVTNGKILRLLVDDEPFDVRYGRLLAHQRLLDLRAGTLGREVDWESPAGKRVHIRSTRLVSLTHRAVAAICYEVEAVEASRITVQSELAANEHPSQSSADPRVAVSLDYPLVAQGSHLAGHATLLVHATRRSGLTMAAGMEHSVEAPGDFAEETDAGEDWARTTVVCTLEPGERLRLIKFLGYGWSSIRSPEAIRDQVAAAVTGARLAGWQGLLGSQRSYLDTFWDSADVEVTGDDALQQAVRFGLFHVLQAAARAERQALPAKGLTGPGYDGHAFWDSEGFVLPLLTYTMPDAAADALRWRHSTLQLAQQRAVALDLYGAVFPWRTIAGQECSGYWPAGTAAFHLNAVIAYAVERYRLVTGDNTLERECGLQLLVETARMWLSLGHQSVDGGWHLDGVTGPDEYSAVADDNVFTNLMAARNLTVAAQACLRHPGLAAELGVTGQESADWARCAAAVTVPYDQHLGVHPQAQGFTNHAVWDFEAYLGRYPLLLHAPYVQLYRKQVCKQADLLLALHWCGDAFTAEDKARDVDYYERITVRDSSLSACTQAVMCAEVGHLELAHEYAHEAALVDLRDLHRNSRDGLHIASLAGAWTALVEGFGGLREHADFLSLDPQLPAGIERIAFRLRRQGARLLVEVDHEKVRVSMRDGAATHLTLTLAGEQVEVTRSQAIVRPLIHREPLLPRPTQPAGRHPGVGQRVPGAGDRPPPAAPAHRHRLAHG